jgi:hypothetical protein
MREHAFACVLGVLLVGLVVACTAQQVLDGVGIGDGSSQDSGVAVDAGSDADAAVLGASCGVENGTGLILCRATDQCPTVVVDAEAFPDCGYRIRGSVVDLVCACGTQLCSMGVYLTCAQAAQLLTSQTEQAVCQQVSENRCTTVDSTSSSSSSSSSTSSSSSSSTSSSGSSGKAGCDRGCLADCGGGAACASVCGC